MAYRRTTRRDDWRRLPRKPEGTARARRLSIRVTKAELAAIHAAAKAAGRTVTDWIVAQTATAQAVA